ncbi:MAG: PIN domain-containing protein [Thermoanaerobaculia bacterium]
MILIDTSGLLAALFPDQRRHAECARALLRAEPPRVISPFVLAELDYLIHKFAGVEAELALMEDIARGAYEVASFDKSDIAAAASVIERYLDLGIGLSDASLVVLAERHHTRDVLTLDERHFRAMRPYPRGTFRILPADD